MKVLTLAALLAPLAVSAGVVPSWGDCGSNDTGGVLDDCAHDNQYCMPWSPQFYQCIDFPAKCSVQFSNYDIYGDDLSVVQDVKHPTDCCEKCSQTSGCVAYTFVNGGFKDTPAPVCYLKKGYGDRRLKQGAISGVLDAAASAPKPTPSPTTTGKSQPPPSPSPSPSRTPTPAPAPMQNTTLCTTPAWGSCGNSNAITCCPDGFYCQPWNANNYQCMKFPTKCGVQATNIDFAGNDMKTLPGLTPDGCCDACATTSGCAAYTFVNDNANGPMCYLKSSVGTDHRDRKGAVSGIVANWDTTFLCRCRWSEWCWKCWESSLLDRIGSVHESSSRIKGSCTELHVDLSQRSCHSHSCRWIPFQPITRRQASGRS